MPRAEITVVKACIKENVNRGAALIGRGKSKLHPGLAVPKDETDSPTFAHQKQNFTHYRVV